MTGLNTVPTARMEKEGTVRIGYAHSDPYNHAFLGIQITQPLYINLRQTMLVSSVGDRPDNVYPALDMKYRLTNEGKYRPEIAFGMDSMVGHRRHSSEYFALSKRFEDFDVTTGVAWGRMASAGQIPNPFAKLGGHFDHDRDFTSEDAAGPSDWFKGKEIGFFGGIEYFTPVEGLSLKADIGADDHPAERIFDSGYAKPAKWSAGLNYSPREWVSLGIAMLGDSKVMARLTLQDNLWNWRGRGARKDDPPALTPRPRETSRDNIRMSASYMDMGTIRVAESNISGELHLSAHEPSSLQIGRAARHLANGAAENIETITIIPITNNTRGKAVTLSRRDLEAALIQRQGSPEEIWRNTSFSESVSASAPPSFRTRYSLHPELEGSIWEDDTTHLYRLSVVAHTATTLPWGFLTGNSLRLNIHDRYHQIGKNRIASDKPVRSDIESFAKKWILLDRSYLGWMGTPFENLHMAGTAGYVEEMYAGLGGEMLYRPFQFPLSVGAEGWWAHKRDSDSFLATGLADDSGTFTGHLNLFYEVPQSDITLFASAGKYLGGDTGGTAGLKTHFGAVKVEGFLTVTNERDKDVFDQNTSYYGGVRLTLPFGNLGLVPEGSSARVAIGPIGRDKGQRIDKPLPLYDITEPASYRHLNRNWQAVLE